MDSVWLLTLSPTTLEAFTTLELAEASLQETYSKVSDRIIYTQVTDRYIGFEVHWRHTVETGTLQRIILNNEVTHL